LVHVHYVEDLSYILLFSKSYRLSDIMNITDYLLFLNNKIINTLDKIALLLSLEKELRIKQAKSLFTFIRITRLYYDVMLDSMRSLKQKLLKLEQDLIFMQK
jgi:hypothetical protein